MWTWAAASRRGTSHERAGTKRQDAYRCVLAGATSAHCLIAIACDGAGSASHGGEGAAIASRSISQAAKQQVGRRGGLPTDEEARGWIDVARDQIAAVASRRGLAPRDFATTLVMAITNAASTCTLHIGDGAVVVRSSESGEWEAQSWPEQGEYASMTYFLTDDVGPRLRIERRTMPIDRLAVFTDGIERLALDLGAKTPHAPFFTGVSAPVASSDITGLDFALSRKLGEYLGSDAINQRTDDDKTLILASYR